MSLSSTALTFFAYAIAPFASTIAEFALSISLFVLVRVSFILFYIVVSAAFLSEISFYKSAEVDVILFNAVTILAMPEVNASALVLAILATLATPVLSKISILYIFVYLLNLKS